MSAHRERWREAALRQRQKCAAKVQQYFRYLPLDVFYSTAENNFGALSHFRAFDAYTSPATSSWQPKYTGKYLNIQRHMYLLL